MTRITLHVRNWLHLAILILIVCVPTTLATIVVGVRALDGFIIATDSKATYGPGIIKGPAAVCKIYQSGSLYFAIAGLANDRNRDFFPERIVASNFSAGDSLPRSMEKLEPAMSDALQVEMKRLKTEDPDAFAYSSRPKVDMLSIIAGEMVDDVPQMSGRSFGYISETATINISRMDCPGDCANGTMFFFAGKGELAINTAKNFPYPRLNLTEDARYLVNLEIQASPEDVGPPITILRVNKGGATWISNDIGCPIVAVPRT
jgi:hypothetical protein